MKEFQAYGPSGTRNANSPQAAAAEYFAAFPKSRKCNVVEGETDGNFFTIRYGRDRPQPYRDVTRKTMQELPK